MSLVWYLGYGSNLDPRRFACYLVGGRPAGGRRDYPGCRDATAPRDSAGVRVAGSLVFAGSSRTWGGGMAFLRADPSGWVLGRAYLITPHQLADVVAQEVRQAPGSEVARAAEEAVSALPERGRIRVSDGPYDVICDVGTLAGVRLVTITRDRVTDLEIRRPAPAYLWWIGSGLRATFGWGDAQIATYLSAAPGVTGEYSRDELVTIVGGTTPGTAGSGVADRP